jgi:LuxR family transcriptional regulator, glucitol operon activator
MASYHRIALYVLFDSIEQDLVDQIRNIAIGDLKLTDDEVASARRVLGARDDSRLNPDDSFDQLLGLDIGTKYQVLLRHKGNLSPDIRAYFSSLTKAFQRIIPVRNAVMHGRPLTVQEYSLGFAFAQQLLECKNRWPHLAKQYVEFTKNPSGLVAHSVEFLERPGPDTVLNNLPVPDYDDTGFLPRPLLQIDIKKKLLGRFPVVTVLGDGGNGKSALALQTLFDLSESNDHPFDAILWFSAKAAALTTRGIEQINDAVTGSADLIALAAELEPGDENPLHRLRKMLSANKILLAIDNLETVSGSAIQELAEDVPGESKVLFTSRVPVGGEITVQVDEFSETEAIAYLRRLTQAYGVRSLSQLDNDSLRKLAKRLHYKPLLLKWLVLGVASGLDPDRIVSNPENALRFCLENVMEKLTETAQATALVLAALPEAASQSVICHVSNLSSSKVQEGLSQLARFGLIDATDTSDADRLFRLKPFARSYVVRIVKPDPSLAEAVRKSYHRIESEFQSAAGVSTYNPYDQKNYVVRTPGEMLAVNKLKEVTRATFDGEFGRAEDIISTLKVSNPTYFEVYRAEAFVAFQLGDETRTIQAFEAALEFGDDQPQLHLFFARMLMRAGENGRASVELDRALELEPNNPTVLREAARNEFIKFNFEEAEKLLLRAEEQPQKTFHDRLILKDLRVQLYVRQMDRAIKTDNYDGAVLPARHLLDFLKQLDASSFDAKLTEHVIDGYREASHLSRVHGIDKQPFAELMAWIETNLPGGRITVAADYGDETLERKTGYLKERGRKPNFGFLVDADGGETFVSKADLAWHDWRRLLGGATAEYVIITHPDGRTQAKDVLIKEF